MSADDRPRPQVTESDQALDDLFAVLSDWRRRIVLDVLADRHGADVSELSERVAAEDAGLSPFEAEVALLHDQLPRLAAAGVVRFDREERRCALRESERTETLLHLLAIVREAA